MRENLKDSPALTMTTENHDARAEPIEQAPDDKPAWETPTLEEVSDRVMAQPYIRFT